MKLIRVQHERCDEPWGTTFLFAPDEKTPEQIDLDVTTCVEKHIKALKDFEALCKAPVYYGVYCFVPSDARDDMTVGQLRKEFEDGRKRYDEWQKQREAIGGSFAKYMTELGYKTLHEAEEEFYTVEVYWGHNHGRALVPDFTDTDVRLNDLIGEQDEL